MVVWGVLKSIAGFPGGSAVKNPPSNAGDTGSIPGSERSPAEGGKWQPTPVLLPGEFYEQRSQAGYSPWDGKELDTTVQLAWRIPGTGQPGGLPSMGSHTVGHD